MEDQEEAEQVRRQLGADHVDVVPVVGRKRQQGRGEGDPPTAGEPAERQVGHQRDPGEEGPHQHPRRVDLCRGVVREGRDHRPQEEQAAGGEAVVRLVAHFPLPVHEAAVEAEVAVFRRQVRRQRQPVVGEPVRLRRPEEVPPLLGEPAGEEDRRQEERRRQEPRTPDLPDPAESRRRRGRQRFRRRGHFPSRRRRAAAEKASQVNPTTEEKVQRMAWTTSAKAAAAVSEAP